MDVAVLSRKLKNYVFSRRFIPVLKGTLAYMLAFVLIFSKRFDGLSKYPLAYISMMIVVITGGPGKSVGACIQAVGLAMIGVLLGSVGFVILAHLSHWPVAQGFVFAVIVYFLALVKARGPRWLPFSLLCILNSFNGVSILPYILGNTFSSTYLIAYLTSYLWGAGIVLSVNILVFPRSSERELRQTLVRSLVHAGTLVHLLSKGYAMEINDEEQALRDQLSQTIRAEFGYLTQQIEETTIEINYSKFSLKDYQALISANSSLFSSENQDIQMYKERWLPAAMTSFNKFHRAIDLTIRELGTELDYKPIVIPATEARYKEFMEHGPCGPTANVDEARPSETSTAISIGRLAEEMAMSSIPPTQTPTPNVSRQGSLHDIEKNTPNDSTANAQPQLPKESTRIGTRIGVRCGIENLRSQFDKFSNKQHDILEGALIDGKLLGFTDRQLKLDKPVGYLRDIYGTDGLDDAPDEPDSSPVLRKRTKSTENQTEGGDSLTKSEDLDADSETVLAEGHTFIRTWGFLFALEQFVEQLESLWNNVQAPGIKRKKRLHIHFFEALKRPNKRSRADGEDPDIPLQEALALLEKRPYTLVKPNFWQRLDHFQKLVQSPKSIFAAKSAAAASVFGTLIYATRTRSWFINFALTSGMLTIIVALAPYVTMLSFVVQIGGAAIGYIWGLAVLEMFRNVGGYTINPFGVVCMILPYALIMQYILYERPSLFVLALLAMNGTGVLVVTEYVAVEYLGRANFDSPALRTGNALMVALAIVAVFQLFILRNPARRTLRQKVAALTFETLSYAVLLQAFGRAVLTSSADARPSKPALLRIEKELKYRELKLQSAIIETMPLISFAAAEPEFSTPFRKDLMLRIIRGNQLILDRYREARAALGTKEFEQFIWVYFAKILSPYRARNTRILKAELYLIASSIQAKAPLPHFTPGGMMTKRERANFVHDCLLLSARFAKTEEGKVSIRSREFMRYMSFILCSTAIIEPVMVRLVASPSFFDSLY
ncbi:hypothetical protein BU17DRAFT_57210 [Hysterangium stoloniferum]|nr:hypothetical protein BU17DRAFT_57210 [Hysterangium stoloniferum]